MLSTVERDRRAAQRKAKTPQEQRVHDRILRMDELVATSGLSRWTIKRAAERGELRLIKLTARAIGARESEFWRWVDSKPA
jgi:predicted DNA-binding transcriptional regulator AlpA